MVWLIDRRERTPPSHIVCDSQPDHGPALMPTVEVGDSRAPAKHSDQEMADSSALFTSASKYKIRWQFWQVSSFVPRCNSM